MFFERPQSGEIAILVQVGYDNTQDEAEAREFEELAISAGAIPAALVTVSRRLTSARTLLGSGKLEELAATIAAHEAQLVLVNHTLTPSQERNLEKELKCRVLDRTGLILDIFAQRARSHEGKLQVELAQLKHSATRLVRGWTHLDRQKGGIGLRGAGETQLEIDQRLIGVRIKAINKSLEKVRGQREQGRRGRRRAEIPTVSLVGYTNAGKSSLFNRLSGDQVYVANQLFATLDSTLRKIEAPGIGPLILADTVGFIRNLPHQLVDAFRATLEETVQAHLLLHVVDCHSDERMLLIEEVDKVLREIGAEDIPTLLVFNKIDLLPEAAPVVERNESGRPIRVWVSAHSGAGIDELLSAIAELLRDDLITLRLPLLPEQGRLRARFYAAAAVLDENQDENGQSCLHLRLPRADFIRLMQEAGADPEPWLPPPAPPLPATVADFGALPPRALEQAV
ncbi:MAG: GTPase HflX [Pseudomonadales bacterium]|nr:GTPase HflX [Pseudomonadales bacterium]